MIAKLKGLIDHIDLNNLILDVNGVGYAVFASSHTLRKIGRVGDAVSLLIETHVREDHINLYGFADAQEKEWFQILCRVQGVGTKVALAILSVATPKDLILGIASGDKNIVKQADGVGPKLATRIITELKDKVGSMSLEATSVSTATGGVANSDPIAPIADDDRVLQDAISALVNLGYQQSDAYKVINDVRREGETQDLSSLITQSLKKLSTGA